MAEQDALLTDQSTINVDTTSNSVFDFNIQISIRDYVDDKINGVSKDIANLRDYVDDRINGVSKDIANFSALVSKDIAGLSDLISKNNEINANNIAHLNEKYNFILNEVQTSKHHRIIVYLTLSGLVIGFFTQLFIFLAR